MLISENILSAVILVVCMLNHHIFLCQSVSLSLLPKVLEQADHPCLSRRVSVNELENQEKQV